MSYTIEQFIHKVQYEDTNYMLQEISPEDVPVKIRRELQEAQDAFDVLMEKLEPYFEEFGE